MFTWFKYLGEEKMFRNTRWENNFPSPNFDHVTTQPMQKDRIFRGRRSCGYLREERTQEGWCTDVGDALCRLCLEDGTQGELQQAPPIMEALVTISHGGTTWASVQDSIHAGLSWDGRVRHGGESNGGAVRWRSIRADGQHINLGMSTMHEPKFVGIWVGDMRE
jgi:hypothetical protein